MAFKLGSGVVGTLSLGVLSWCLRVASYSCVFVVIVPQNVRIGVFLCGKVAL